jgi:hypothetical protein
MHHTPLTRRARVRVATALSTMAIGASLLVGLSGPAGALTIKPDSASGCSDSVCIFVTGTGLNVSNWETTDDLPKTECTYAKFLENGVLIYEGGETCGSAGDGVYSNWSDPGNFPNGTQLCNEWTGIAGDACITVHS